MAFSFQPGEVPTAQFFNRLVATLGALFFLAAVCVVWLVVGTMQGLYKFDQVESRQAGADASIQVIEADVAEKNDETWIRLAEMDLIMREQQHEIEVLTSRMEVVQEAIDGDKKRKAKRNIVIAAIKDTLPKYGNPIKGCPDTPSPGEIWSIASAIVDHSEDYSISAAFIAAVIRQESAFCNKAVSPVGARGYMQLMPETAAAVSADVAIKNGRALRTWRGRDNIQLGTAYLSAMLLEFDGDYLLAARAYNAGPTHVKKVLAGLSGPYTCDGEPSQFYCETQHYSEAVMKFKAEYEKLGL